MAALYLSRLTLDPSRPQTQRDLADCHQMHRRVMSGFPDLLDVQQARERFGVLYRVEQGRERLTVLAQSRAEPDWSRLPEGYLLAAPEVKSLDPLYARLRPDMALLFRLHANPTRRVAEHNTREPEHWRGKRVNLTRESEQLDWLRRKSDANGFALLTAHARPVGSATPAPRSSTPPYQSATTGATTSAETVGRRAGTGILTFGAVQLEGRLRITDLERFRAALEQGIGSGKAYGFGLLSVAPVTPE